ncbi:hypothetical protein X975_25744, partial [Stegodyphus mimosarum]
MSKSLVADYESTSEEEDEDCLKSGKETHVAPLASAAEMLDQNGPNISTSVFTNPYREAANYEQAILEKHVKMTTVKEPEFSQTTKVCFKFYKGKCKLGDKCRFLHHNTTIINDPESDETIDNKQKRKRCGLKDDLVPPNKYMRIYSKLKK